MLYLYSSRMARLDVPVIFSVCPSPRPDESSQGVSSCWKPGRRATMSSISMVERRLPPGFRFHPRDDELVLDYLCRKLSGRGGAGGIAMVDVDLNKCEPWDLPVEARVGGSEWYFFSLHDRKYATGHRTNRATRSGYWKATGKDRPIFCRRGAVVGMRKTLVFYRGRAPRGSKTEWVMHEFRVEGSAVADALIAARPGSPPLLKLQEDWVLCRVFYRSRTVTTGPTADDVEATAGSLSNNELIISVPMMPPMQHTPADVDAYLLAIDHAPAATIGGYYHHHHHHQEHEQDDDTDDGGGLPAARVINKSLSSFRELLTSMVGPDGGAVAAKPELYPDWTEAAAYAQHAAAASSSHAWNPFLSSG